MTRTKAVTMIGPRDPYDPRLVRLGDLLITADQQREIDPKAVEKIERAWDWRLAEVPQIATIDGTLTVVGHQHTVVACRNLFGDDALIWCRDQGDLPAAEAAGYGWTMNTSPRRPSSVSTWESKVKAKEPFHVQVDLLLTSLGLRMGRSLDSRTLTCAAYLGMLGRRSGDIDGTVEVLHDALQALMLGYPTGTTASDKRFQAELVRAVTEFCFENPAVAPERIAQRCLAGTDPVIIVSHAKIPGPRPAWVVIGQSLTTTFNKRLRNDSEKATWRD